MKQSLWIVLAMVFAVTLTLAAHDPKFLYINQKSVTAKVGDTEATLSYYSPPATLSHLDGIANGAFQPWFGSLSLSADIEGRKVSIPAGKYTVGALKNSASDWTMALYPGEIQRGSAPDLSKLIKLDSMLTSHATPSPNVAFDITVGHGKLANRYVLVWRFATMTLEGALS